MFCSYLLCSMLSKNVLFVVDKDLSSAGRKDCVVIIVGHHHHSKFCCHCSGAGGGATVGVYITTTLWTMNMNMTWHFSALICPLKADKDYSSLTICKQNLTKFLFYHSTYSNNYVAVWQREYWKLRYTWLLDTPLMFLNHF